MIGVPAFATMVRLLYVAIIRSIKLPQHFSDIFIGLLMFRLPKQLRESYRWFVPIYYGSLAVGFLAPPTVGIWLLLRAM